MIALKSILACFFVLATTSNLGSYRTLTTEEAEKILGQTAKLTEQHLEEKEGLVTYKSTYQATTTDATTGKLGALYYLFEKYPNAKESQKVFDEIIASNSSMSGQQRSTVMGNETWIHTDQSNFYLIMFRKENKIVRAKINKLTSRTDLNELINVLKKIDESLN